MQILNEEEGNGRKVDLLMKTKYDDVTIELYSIEFKTQGANNNIFKQ